MLYRSTLITLRTPARRSSIWSKAGYALLCMFTMLAGSGIAAMALHLAGKLP